MKTILPLLLTVLLFACSDSSDLNEEIIIPGAGITSINFGDSAQQVFNAFGNVPPRAINFNSGFRYFLDYTDGVTFVIEDGTTEELDNNLKVIGMTFESPFGGETDKNISIGSSRSDIIAAYGEPDSDFAGILNYFELNLLIDLEDDLVSYIQITE